VSKYRNKQKQNKPKVFKQEAPKNVYECECHGVQSMKKPCAKGNGEPDDKGFFQSPLGTWTCSVTRKACKVTRTKKAPKVEEAPAEVPTQEASEEQELVWVLTGVKIEDVHASL
jgi:hypothetical protein